MAVMGTLLNKLQEIIQALGGFEELDKHRGEEPEHPTRTEMQFLHLWGLLHNLQFRLLNNRN